MTDRCDVIRGNDGLWFAKAVGTAHEWLQIAISALFAYTSCDVETNFLPAVSFGLASANTHEG